MRAIFVGQSCVSCLAVQLGILKHHDKENKKKKQTRESGFTYQRFSEVKRYIF